jgi:hypothetical protein
VIDFQFLLLVIFTVVTGVIVRLVIPVQLGGNKAGRAVLRYSTTPKGTGAMRSRSCQHATDDPGRHNRVCQEAPPPDAAAAPDAADVKTAEYRIRAGARVTQTYISRVELGDQNVTLASMVRLARAVGLDVSLGITGADPTPRATRP